jgi:type II secretion system protein G
MRVSKKKQKGFTLVELLVVVAILAILAAILLPRFLGYTDKAREAQTMKDIRSMCTVVEAFTATDGNYPEASLDTDNPRSIASIMQSKGIKWTGDETGVVDPWKNPYYYDLVGDYYCIASPGKDGILNTSDDICSIGKVSKKASGLDGNAIPSAVPGNNPGNGNEEHLSEVPDGYIGIYTPEQLASIGNDPDYPLDGNYIVMDTIDLSEYDNWTPIGNYGSDEISIFTGTFDGNNYVISNLTINRDADYQGLFGYTEEATIENLGLENVDVEGGRNTGGLVGWNFTGCTIKNCYATGSVEGDNNTGGLVGYNESGTIENCYTTGKVSGSGNCIGGLVGYNYGIITNSYATGSVSGNNYYTGGLVGFNYYGSITNSYATGSVTGYSGTGGLVGENNGTITDSYATGSVTGYHYTGGLVGNNHGTIENSYATGSVTSNNRTGGLVGRNYGSITDCYATGSVTGGSSETGGLVGQNNGSITNCYATGEVTGDCYTGGLVGYNYNNGTITNSYATGSVEGIIDTGGLVGQNNGTITNSYATGSVEGSGHRTGGLVGNNKSTISSCYATGKVTGDRHTGGLVGYNQKGSITNCYATGEVTGGSNTGGGLVGENNGTITDCYYDTETTGQSDDDGRGTPLTTAEMKNSVNFTNWDFDTVWGIDQGNSYPYLINNKQIPHPGT